MRILRSLAVASALAAVCLAAFATGATASTGIRLASGTALTVTARGVVTLTVAGINMICTWDLLIVINSSIAKSTNSVIGTVRQTGSTISNCNGGYSGTVDSNVPITYTSFGGTLPSSITSINSLGSGWAITKTGGTVFGTNRCQYRGHLTTSFVGPGTSLSGVRLAGTLTSAGSGCPSTERVTSGTLTFYANASLGTTLTSVAITLF